MPACNNDKYAFQFICYHRCVPFMCVTHMIRYRCVQKERKKIIKLDHQFSPLNGKWIRFQSHLPHSVSYSFFFTRLFIYSMCVTMKNKARHFSHSITFEFERRIYMDVYIRLLPIFWNIECRIATSINMSSHPEGNDIDV